WARAGGFGPLLGDEGSAFWLGREWLRATTEGEDFKAARRFVRVPHAVARIAALAPAVVARARRGDARARRIVAQAQRHLPGVVAVPLERGERVRRLDHDAAVAALETAIAARGLGERVTVRRACVGGCYLGGPNVGVVAYPLTPPGEKPDHVAVAWKTYVGSLETLRCLGDVLDDNISAGDAPGGRRRAVPSRRR